MSFNVEKFDAAQVTIVTKTIPVPELKAFFGEDEKAEWEVRGMTGTELFIANEAASVASKTKVIIEAIASGTEAGLKKGLNTFLNKNDQMTPEELVRRHKMLELASIPPCPENVCVKLAHNKPTTFTKITNEIIKLTGDGADLGE
jgi:hypothetical protein